MNRRNFNHLLSATGLATLGQTAAAKPSQTQPNLLIIHTDEHSFRTLGCYRELMKKDQAYVWGPDVKVDTPHIDSLARDGALCMSCYATSPVCTPSRASFISGLYPEATGSWKNDIPLNQDVISFAEVLRREGYATSYVGKWHLDGEAKLEFGTKRKFGFSDNRWMFNNSHVKILKKTPKGFKGFWGKKLPAITDSKGRSIVHFSLEGAKKEEYMTDFLCDRTLEILQRDQAKPFCHMLSIPDPHSPNQVREPYDQQFAQLNFQPPRTMAVPKETRPSWGSEPGKNDDRDFDPIYMSGYFGMVKCIDDTIGRLLEFLKTNGLEDNTIVVFTADHGDMLFEHRRSNKGVPYEASARIPFLIRWPKKIKPGKVVRTPSTTADFAPTILGLMGAPQIDGCHGMNGAGLFLAPETEMTDDRIVYVKQCYGGWVAAIDQRYKLVIATNEDPYLFDLQEDPDELINEFNNPRYRQIAAKLGTELKRRMEELNDPALSQKHPLRFS